MTGTGYWLLEPDATDFLAHAPREFAEAALGWLAAGIADRLRLSEAGVSLEVIETNYHGPYPCLAARSVGGELRRDLEDRVTAAAEAMLRGETAGSVLRACATAIPRRQAA